MSSVSTYLHFPGNTEEAFLFYQSVFGGEFEGGMYRYSGVPASEDMAPMDEETKNKVMHVSLQILGGHRLMGTDALESIGWIPSPGTNISISLHPDTRIEADSLFVKLSEGGVITSPLTEMYWGDYYGTLTDKFGIQWVINTEGKE